MSIPVCARFTQTMRRRCEHLPRLGYSGPTHWKFLSLCTPLHPYTPNDTCLMLFLYLPALLYSNDVSPSKVSKLRHLYPLLAPVDVFSLAHIYGPGLCPLSTLACDLLFHGLLKAPCQKSIPVTVSKITAWRTLGLLSSFHTLVGGHQWFLGATFLVREIDCGNCSARGYMPAHKHRELFYLLAGDSQGRL